MKISGSRDTRRNAVTGNLCGSQKLPNVLYVLQIIVQTALGLHVCLMWIHCAQPLQTVRSNRWYFRMSSVCSAFMNLLWGVIIIMPWCDHAMVWSCIREFGVPKQARSVWAVGVELVSFHAGLVRLCIMVFMIWVTLTWEWIIFLEIDPILLWLRWNRLL